MHDISKLNSVNKMRMPYYQSSTDWTDETKQTRFRGSPLANFSQYFKDKATASLLQFAKRGINTSY